MAQAPAPAPKAAAAKPKAAAPAKPAAAKPAAAAAPKAAAKPAAAAKPKPAAPKAAAGGPTTDDEKTIYSLGLMIQKQLEQFDLSPAEIELVKKAISDGASGKPAVKLEEWGPRINQLNQARSGRASEKEKEAGKVYAAKAAAELGALKTESGMIYQELQAGSGASPKATDNVKVHYKGTLINGTEFDSSYKRNEPAQFPLNGVIRCWTEGVQKMKVGGKAKLVCPSDVAYGDRGRPPTIPGGATLVFEVELIEIPGGEAK